MNETELLNLKVLKVNPKEEEMRVNCKERRKMTESALLNRNPFIT